MGIYLDYAAATPVDTEVLAAMQPFFADQFYNPSAIYGPAMVVSKALDQARANIAVVLGAKTPEIIFTAGGTEANNLAIHGILSDDDHVIYSAIEHDSVRRPAERYAHSVLQVNEQGIVDPLALTKLVTDNTKLISVMYANNEIGTVQPIKRIAAEIEGIRRQRIATGNKRPLYLHVDAAQAGNYLDMHVHRLGIDLMTINGGKLYGPKQSGVLFVRTGVVLGSVLQGGGQERNIRSGTENVPAAIGLAKALQKSVELRHAESERLLALQQQLVHGLKDIFPGVIVNGSLKHRLPNNVHVTLPGCDNERVLMALDMHEIYAAAGSACSASHDEPSHVLAALGVDERHIRSSIRFSTGRQTTADDITQLLATLKSVV